MDGKHIREFYANATAWRFDGDAESHIVAARERQAAEFDRWLAKVKADAWAKGHDDGMERVLSGNYSDPEAFPNPYRQGGDL